MIGKIACAALTGALALFAVAERRASKGNVKNTPDVLLILGCRVRGSSPEKTLEMRIEAASKYLNEYKSVIAIPCGGIVHADQNKSEAQAIYEGLVSRGVEKERIILEDKSTTTRENFINAKKIIDSLGFDGECKIAMLSSDFHLLRAEIIAKKCGLYPNTVAADSPRELKIKNYLRELVCLPDALIK